jgi:hypothetical protein
MSDHRESYESVDRFSEYIRQRLKTYPVAPDRDCWDEIEARLQQRQRRQRDFPSFRIGLLLIAASLLTAVFVINHLLIKEEPSAYRKENPTETAFAAGTDDAVAMNKQTVPDSRIPATEQPVDKQHPNVVDESGTKSDAFCESGINPDLVSKAEAKPDALAEAGTKPDALREAEAKPDAEDRREIAGRETPPPTDNQQPDPKAENTPNQATTTTGPEPPARRFENRIAYHRTPDENKRNNRPERQLSAGFSPVGGLSSFGSFLNARDNRYNVSAAPGDNYDDSPGTGTGTGPDASPEEQIVDVKPSIPFSVGITMRRKWNRTLGIETGLVYTRLSSDLVVDRAGSHYDAVLILHYVGLPVNLTLQLWEHERFGLYASGGGMVEKGLRSVLKQKTPLFPAEMNRDRVNRISGLQWSLQGSIGLSYHLYREMSLYLEPGLSYYFDGKQPLSKRTQDPLNFNLRLGLRYDF